MAHELWPSSSDKYTARQFSNGSPILGYSTDAMMARRPYASIAASGYCIDAALTALLRGLTIPCSRYQTRGAKSIGQTRMIGQLPGTRMELWDRLSLRWRLPRVCKTPLPTWGRTRPLGSNA